MLLQDGTAGNTNMIHWAVSHSTTVSTPFLLFSIHFLLTRNINVFSLHCCFVYSPLLSLSICISLQVSQRRTFVSVTSTCLSIFLLSKLFFYAISPLLYNLYMYFVYSIWWICIVFFCLPLLTFTVLSLFPSCALVIGFCCSNIHLPEHIHPSISGDDKFLFLSNCGSPTSHPTQAVACGALLQCHTVRNVWFCLQLHAFNSNLCSYWWRHPPQKAFQLSLLGLRSTKCRWTSKMLWFSQLWSRDAWEGWCYSRILKYHSVSKNKIWH